MIIGNGHYSYKCIVLNNFCTRYSLRKRFKQQKQYPTAAKSRKKEGGKQYMPPCSR